MNVSLSLPRFSFAISLLIGSAFISMISGNAFAQQPVHLENASRSYRLDHYVQVFADSTNDLSFKDILQPHIQERFRPNKDNLTFGYVTSTLWLKVTTRRSSAADQWYLEIPAPFLEYVDFYQLQDDNTWQHSKSGYFRKHSERSISHTAHVSPLIFSDDSLNTTFVQIGGISPKTFTVNAMEKDKFVQKIRGEDLGYGVFFGILFVMLCYNLYLYFTLRQKTYFLYVLIIALTSLIFGAISGYGGKFVWPENPHFNYFFGKLALEVLIICITLYTMNFLEVRKFSKVMYRVLQALLPLSAIALLLSATETLVAAGNHLITLSTVTFISAGVFVRIRGNRAGTYFVAAWSFYFLGGLLLTLRNSGMFDYNFWTTHFVEIGAILGVTLMGFGLGAQYRRLQKEKEEAQQMAYRIQQEDTARLEVKVKERTTQLYDSHRELEKTLEKNKLQTQIIEEKNAELDSFFYRVSHDLKGPVLSSLGLMALAKLDVKDKVALEYIEKQTAQLERLSQIINGLVNLTRLKNSDLRKERIDFRRMVDDCIVSFNHIPNFSRLRFEKEIKDVRFFCEWTLLNTIVQNLIENSIKYSRGDNSFVKVRIFDDADCLVIQVEDNGRGIPAEHQTKIFEMFYRATEEVEGSGLGLYIIKRSVDRLNGTVEIKSDVDVGSTFTVRLPLQTQDQEAKAI